MKYRLLAPGPTPVPDRVLKEMCRTIIHHRTEMFEGIFGACKEGLAWLLGTQTPPLVLASSGTGAFEAGIQNFSKRVMRSYALRVASLATTGSNYVKAFTLMPLKWPFLGERRLILRW